MLLSIDTIVALCCGCYIAFYSIYIFSLPKGSKKDESLRLRVKTKTRKE